MRKFVFFKTKFKKISRFFSSIIFLVGLFLFVGPSKHCYAEQVNKIKAGVLDLSTFNFEKEKDLDLQGKWKFYWKKFIDPKEISSANLPHEDFLMSVPDSWSNYNKIKPKGHGSYLLHIKGSKKNREMYFYPGRLTQTARIFFIQNGKEKLIFEAGRPGKNEKVELPQINSSTQMRIDIKKGDFFILVHTSNYGYRDGGFSISPQFFHKINFKKNYFKIFTGGILLVMAIYHFGLFARRRQDKAALYFGFVCLTMYFRHSVINDHQYFFLKPSHWNHQISIKLEYLGLSLPPLFFAGFLKNIFPGHFFKIFRFSLIISSIFTLAILFLPVSIFTQKFFLTTVLFYILINFVSSIIIFVVLHFKKNIFAKYCLISMGIFFTTALLDTLDNFHIINYEIKLSQFGFIFWIVSQSYILSVKFSKAYETADTLSKNLEKEVNDRTQELSEEKNSVANLLDNMGQAVFTIDIEGTIQSRAISRYSEKIFGQDIKGLGFYDLAYPNIPKGSEESSAILFAMSTCFESDHIQWELNQGLLPKKSTIQVNGKTKIIEILPNPIFNDGIIEEFMMTVTDITEKVNLEQEMASRQKEENRRVRVLQELAPPIGMDIAHHSKDIKDLFLSTVELLNEMENMFQGDNLTQNKFNHIARHIHTIKGNARAYSLTSLTSFIHNVESKLDEAEGDWDQERTTLVRNNIEKIKEEFDFYQKIGRDVFSILTGDKDKVEELSTEIYKINLDNLKKATSQYFTENSEQNLKALKRAEEDLVKTPYTQHLKTFNKIVSEASEEVKKKVHFKSGGDEIFVAQETFHLLNDSLIHLIRNCIDHGIEDGKDRISQGKKAEGTLEILCREKEESHHISIRDDGKGINGTTISALAINKKLTTLQEVSSMTEEEKVKLIFSPGFSSAEEVSEMSGRGVGMDVVKTNIEKLDGKIEIKTTPGQGTEFLITLPLKHS